MECIRHARQLMPDATISVEVEKPGREGLQELAAEADVVFFSKSWAEDQGFTTSKSFLEDQGKRLKERRYVPEPRGQPGIRRDSLNTNPYQHSPTLFCTWGAQGSRAWHSGMIEHAKPLTTDVKVVDPVGAGDSFIAGVLFALALHRGNSISKALRLGITVAEAKVQREGFQGLEGSEANNQTRWLA